MDVAVVYPAGGISSRFNGDLKQFSKVGPSGENLIEYSLNQALQAGITKIFFIVSDQTEMPFKERFGDSYRGVPVFYVNQSYDSSTRKKPWGTADALCCVKGILDCPFIFCNSDDIYGYDTFKMLVKHLRDSQDGATVGYRLVEALPDLGKANRGIFEVKDGFVKSIPEKYGILKENIEASGCSPDDLCSMNIFALHSGDLDHLCRNVEEFKTANKDNPDAETLIQHELTKLIDEGKLKLRLYSSVDRPFGVTFPEDVEIVREIIKELESVKEKEIAVVFMVAGLSSRFQGKVKAFASVGPGGESLIEYSINQALEAGFNRIIFIVSKKTEQFFKEKFGDSYRNISVSYALQEFDESGRDRPWGTCDAVCSATKLLDCPFLVCTGDDIYGLENLKTLYNHLNESNDEATLGFKLIETLPEGGTVNRGIFEVKEGQVLSIKEHVGVNRENLAEKGLINDSLSSGSIFALHPETLEYLNKRLETFKEEHKGDRKIECYLPEMLSELISENKIGMKIYANKEKCLGITNPEDELVVRGMLAEYDKTGQ